MSSSISSQVLQFRTANCKNCYKCIRNCPVKSIRVKNHQAQIISEECILCEQCTLVCPQNAKEVVNQIPMIKNEILAGKKVIASLHPSYLVEYGAGSLASLSSCLTELGFSAVTETADAAELLCREYERCLREADGRTLLTTHCPVSVKLIKKHYPALADSLLPVLSPMQIHGRMLRESDPDAVIVYVSPCIASLCELREPNNYVDYVITYQELQRWFLSRELTVENCGPKEEAHPGRAIAMTGGVSGHMIPIDGYRSLPVQGLANIQQILFELQPADSSDYRGYLLDLYACENGCIGGPSFRNGKTQLLKSILELEEVSRPSGASSAPSAVPASDPVLSPPMYRELRGFRTENPEEPSEAQIQQVLQEMGKLTTEDMLNCGACGYNTCREKAIAVCQGKAEISMCVPYMQERQESYSNKIINAMPGLLVTVDYDLHVVHMNRAAQDFFCMTDRRRIIGSPVSEIMDDESIIDMIAYRKSLAQDQIRIPENGKTLDRVFTNDRKNRLILCIMKDITRDLARQHELRKAQLDAAAMADQLVREQLQIVQQIAGLLGETAADTKVAVEELKRTIMMDTGERHEK